MDTMTNVHDAMTLVIGSAADASGIAIAFHVDNIAGYAIAIVTVVHAAFGLYLFIAKHRKHSRRIVGFVPPKH